MHGGYKKLTEVYEHIKVECPFLAAKELGLNVSSQALGDIAGWYFHTANEQYHILLNSEIHRDIQIQACEQLVMQHLLHPGIQKVLTVDQLKKPVPLFWKAAIEGAKEIVSHPMSLFSFSK
jgi:hypothetical protein